VAVKRSSHTAGSLPCSGRGHLICSRDSGALKMIASLALGTWLAGLLAASAVSAQALPFALPTCEAEAATFSNIRLPQALLANGKPVAAGTYQVRLTTERPAPDAGQSSNAECWVEFVKSGAVAGREMATVISAEDISSVAKGPAPGPNASRVEVLKGGQYMRVWINSSGTHDIINMPVAR